MHLPPLPSSLFPNIPYEGLQIINVFRLTQKCPTTLEDFQLEKIRTHKLLPEGFFFSRFQQKGGVFHWRNVQGKKMLMFGKRSWPCSGWCQGAPAALLRHPAYPAVSIFPNTPVKRSTHTPPSHATVRVTSTRFLVRVEFATTSHLDCLYEVKFKPQNQISNLMLPMYSKIIEGVCF